MPPIRQRRMSHLQHPNIPRRLQHKGRSSVVRRQALDLLDDVRVLPVDDVRRAQGLGELEPFVDDVHDDDFGEVEVRGGEDCAGADGSDAEDGDGGSGGGFEEVDDCSCAKGEKEELKRIHKLCRTEGLPGLETAA